MEGMHRRNITILEGIDKLTHWTGTPAVEGGELNGIDMSGPSGPPVWDYDTKGDDRKQYKFNVDTKILGATEAEQEAFIARYPLGRVFRNDKISGLPGGLDWVIALANPKHGSDGEAPSTLTLRLDEVGPTAAVV